MSEKKHRLDGDLPDLTQDQEEALAKAIKNGDLDFEVLSVNPGNWSYDIQISVQDHEFKEAALLEKTKGNYRVPINSRSDAPDQCKCISEVESKMRAHGLTISGSAMMLDAVSMKTVYGFPLQTRDGGKIPKGKASLVSFSHCPFCGCRLPDFR